MARDYEGMMEGQWENSLRTAQDPNSAWSGWNPEVVDYYRNNAPGGFGSWGSNLTPGQELTQQQVAEVIANLDRPGYYEGVNGMTLQQYLNDPRSVISVKDGKFVFAPKTSVQGVGQDFVSKDRESFLESLGAIPMLAGFLAGPAMQIAGIGSLGAAGAAAGNAGAEFFGAQSFLGDMASTAASTGAAGAAGAGAAGGAMDMGVGLGGELGTWGGITPIDTMGIENFLNTGINEFGQGASQFPSLPTTPTNINFAPGGINTVDQMINSIATGGEATFGTVGSGIGSIAQGLGQFPGGLTQTQTIEQVVKKVASGTPASMASKFLKDTFNIDVDADTLSGLAKVAGVALGVKGASDQADASKELFNQYWGLGAPYRAELANLNANPSSFYGSPIFQGALQQGSDALTRSLSAKVGNPILNPTALTELQNYTTRGSLDAFNNRWNQLASAGQLGTSQAANLGTLANQSQGNTYNAIGAGLQSVFGNQRDYTGEMLDIINRRDADRSSGNKVYLDGWGP